MATLSDIKKKLNRTFKERSATPPEVEKIVGDFIIIKYEERDPITGGSTKDYLYTISDLEGNVVDENHSYGELELCEKIIEEQAMNDEKKIDAVVDHYNKERYYIRHAV